MDTLTTSKARTLESNPIAPSLFAHFVLRSSNMARMVDWYCTVLNMHVVQRNDFFGARPVDLADRLGHQHGLAHARAS